MSWAPSVRQAIVLAECIVGLTATVGRSAEPTLPVLTEPALCTATGTFVAVFTQACPLASLPEVDRRYGQLVPPDSERYAITNESFVVHVPAAYTPDKSWGLFVFIDPRGVAEPNREWPPVLEQHRLVWIAPRKADNERPWISRIRLTLEAAYGATRNLALDQNRLYVAGVSGGGRVSSTVALMYADIFRGGYYMVGCDYFRNTPSIKDPDVAYRAIFVKPSGPILDRARSKGRYVLLTGETDGNRDQTLGVYRHGYAHDGFRHVTYLEVPGMGHASPPLPWFTKGLEALDPLPETNPVPIKAAAPATSGAP